MPSASAAHRAAVQAVAAVLIDGSFCMGMLLLEALLALVILIAIVWWTMFAGRHKGELRDPEGQDDRRPPR